MSIQQLYREATWRRRVKPGAIIIGAQKSGTTSLFHAVHQHPQVLSGRAKELHFFENGSIETPGHFQRGNKWYASHFPLQRNVKSNQLCIEATPAYLFSPLAPARIFDFDPNIKLIAILRDPVERAISHYFHSVRKGVETLSPLEAFKEEAARLKNESPVSSHFFDYSYKLRGMYARQLTRYIEIFGRERLLVVCAELFFSSAKRELLKVFDFLEVDSNFLPADLAAQNVGLKKHDVCKDTTTYLASYFESANQELYRLLDVEFPWATGP